MGFLMPVYLSVPQDFMCFHVRASMENQCSHPLSPEVPNRHPIILFFSFAPREALSHDLKSTTDCNPSFSSFGRHADYPHT